MTSSYASAAVNQFEVVVVGVVVPLYEQGLVVHLPPFYFICIYIFITNISFNCKLLMQKTFAYQSADHRASLPHICLQTAPQ